MRRLVVALLAVAVLGAGLLVDHAERAWPSTRPFVRTGTVGEEVRLWPGWVEVRGARAANSYVDPYGDEIPTDGVWVAVDVVLTGGREPVGVAQWTLEDAAGRRFQASERGGAYLMDSAQPESPLRGEIVFEVPRDALGRLVVRAGTRGADDRLGAVAAIDVTVEEVSQRPMTAEQPRWEER